MDTRPIENLLRALWKGQDWGGTYIGECMEAVDDLLPKIAAMEETLKTMGQRDGEHLARIAALERENAELRKFASALVPLPDGTTVLSVDIKHRVTKPEEPR